MNKQQALDNLEEYHRWLTLRHESAVRSGKPTEARVMRMLINNQNRALEIVRQINEV